MQGQRLLTALMVPCPRGGCHAGVTERLEVAQGARCQVPAAQGIILPWVTAQPTPALRHRYAQGSHQPPATVPWGQPSPTACHQCHHAPRCPSVGTAPALSPPALAPLRCIPRAAHACLTSRWQRLGAAAPCARGWLRPRCPRHLLPPSTARCRHRAGTPPLSLLPSSIMNYPASAPFSQCPAAGSRQPPIG